MFIQSILLFNRSILHLFLYDGFLHNIFVLFFTVGIVNNECSFDEPNVCGYNVSCREATQYLWKRGRRSTQTYQTGPYMYYSNSQCEYILLFLLFIYLFIFISLILN